MGCPAYRARLEDSLSGGVADIDRDSGLRAHLDECVHCREALETALLASELVRDARKFEPEPSEVFVTRVMAAIRQQEGRLIAPSAIWRPLALLASRFALVAAVALLALSLYLAEAGPAGGTTTVQTATPAAVSADFPQPPAAPSTPDDVLISLAEKGNGI